MSGQIFISYRRDDSSAWAGRLSDRLSSHFPANQIFMDVDTIEPGMDFVAAIENSVGSCEVLIAVIGKRWLDSSDGKGKRRLDNPEDSVRLEIATALKRNIRVIPVLVDGTLLPPLSDLPGELKLLARRNALDVSHNRFYADFGQLVATLEKVLGKGNAEPHTARGDAGTNQRG
jgi:TIR domain